MKEIESFKFRRFNKTSSFKNLFLFQVGQLYENEKEKNQRFKKQRLTIQNRNYYNTNSFEINKK